MEELCELRIENAELRMQNARAKLKMQNAKCKMDRVGVRELGRAKTQRRKGPDVRCQMSGSIRFRLGGVHDAAFLLP